MFERSEISFEIMSLSTLRFADGLSRDGNGTCQSELLRLLLNSSLASGALGERLTKSANSPSMK
jgi:hypothetical protein